MRVDKILLWKQLLVLIDMRDFFCVVLVDVLLVIVVVDDDEIMDD